MDLFFNELSLSEADEPYTAKIWLSNLIKLYLISKEMGCNGIKVTKDILDKNIAPNYKILDWLTDKSVDHDLRLLFKTNFLKYPFIDDLIEQQTTEGIKLFDFKYRNEPVKGFGAAYLFDSLTVSFDNSAEWDCTSVSISTFFLEEDEIEESTHEVKHSSKPSHFDILKAWIIQKNKPTIQNGKSLWLKKDIIFPNLVFCNNVRNQIINLNDSHAEFVQIKKKLFELEDYSKKWIRGYFDSEALPSKATPESTSRLNKFTEKLTFACPDNTNRLFSWHLRFTPGAGRIYFFPVDNLKKIIIGYIGYKID